MLVKGATERIAKYSTPFCLHSTVIEYFIFAVSKCISGITYQHFPLVSCFPWLYVCGGCTTICGRYIHIRESWVLLLYYFSVLFCAQIIEYIMAQWSYLIIVIIQTYLELLIFQSACQVRSLECVSNIKSILSINFHAIYGDMCIQPTNVSCDDHENTYNLSYHHHKIGSMNHLPWNIIDRIDLVLHRLLRNSNKNTMIWKVSNGNHFAPVSICHTLCEYACG